MYPARTAAPSTARRPAAPSTPARPAAPAPSAQPAVTDHDNDKFETKARELLAPAADRPAVVVAPEVEAIRREYRSGQGRYDALKRLALTRLAYVDAAWGRPPRVPLTTFERTEAAEFFKAYKLEPGPQAIRPEVRVPEAASFGPGKPAAPAPAPSTPAPATPAPVKPTPAAAPSTGGMVDGMLAAMMAELKALRKDVTALRQELAERQAAAPSTGGEAFTDFLADAVKVGVYENTGEKTFKLQGPTYRKHGIRVWPEVLEQLGINGDALKFGENKLPKAIKVRALMVDGKPKKVTGLA